MENKELSIDADPYKLRDEDVLDPPKGWKESLKYLGPGLILSAAVVGSGEVITVPILGAKVGMYGLWLILLSCVVKLLFLEELFSTFFSNAAAYRRFAIGYFAIRTPVALVFLGGITGTLMIPVIAWVSVYLGNKIDKNIGLNPYAKWLMYVCAVIVTIIGTYTLYDLIV